MDFKIKGQNFIVGGAGKGFGRAIAESIVNEGGNILAISRSKEPLLELKELSAEKIEIFSGDIFTEDAHNIIMEYIEKNGISGIVFNGGGPPAGGLFDVNLAEWESAWQSVVRWKIELSGKVLPYLMKSKYGRMLFIESVSVKQPVENLILSNALRPAVVGYVSTMAQEVAAYGITANILAPGYHSTDAMKRLFVKKAEVNSISVDEARNMFESEIPVGEMGKPEEMASLALWLLSPLSRYITGQTITHAGGIVRSIFG